MNTKGITESLLHPENRPPQADTSSGTLVYSEAFALAMVEAAFRHGWYSGHADAKQGVTQEVVSDRVQKYMELSPSPARFAATVKIGRAA